MKIIINASWIEKIRKVLGINNRCFKSKKEEDELIEEIKKGFPKGAIVKVKIIKELKGSLIK